MESDQKKPAQSDKFREAAREAETDDDEKRFDEKLGKVAKAARNEKPTTED